MPQYQATSSTADRAAPTAPMVSLTIDGQEVTVPEGSTILQAARQAGIEIPVLCHSERLAPVGVCRMCVVDVGERVLAAACVRACQPGMQVQTGSPFVRGQRLMLTRLLLGDIEPSAGREHAGKRCEVEALAAGFGIPVENAPADILAAARRSGAPGALAADARRTDDSSPVIAVDHQACILCDRCIRACDDLQSNDVLGRTGKGHATRIAFDLNLPMGQSSCVSCGECAAVCPTRALVHKPRAAALAAASLPAPRAQVDTVCPYCGVGCAITAHTTSHGIAAVEGRDSPVNHARLCVKGRYGWDYALHPQRLTRPLIRRPEYYPKGPLSSPVRGSNAAEPGAPPRKPGGMVDDAEVLPAFREATWDEALDLVAGRLLAIRQSFGSAALAGFGSAKCSNEEAYLFQKLVRAVFGTNNVDHCTRLCHASSVAALMQTIGSGAVTNVFTDVERAQVALVTGSSTAHNHPVAATFIKQAARRGNRLIVVDVRRVELARFATHFAQIRPGTDVAFYNGLMHVLIAEDLIDRDFIDRRTEDFEPLKQHVLRDYSPEAAAAICGVPADEIRAIARTIGRAASMMIFWGMGISQHTTGTDNARCLIDLCLLTGNVGRPGTGLHPLRGQNNVQGASDAGLIPFAYPDYQVVTAAQNRLRFEQAWGRPLDPNAGLTVVEIAHAALEGKVKGMYILGENPFLSDPNTNKVRRALANLDFLVVQDIFLTETAEFADVILPATSYFEKTGTYTNTDRRVQLGRKVMDPPGQAREDWRVICEISTRMGYPMNYESPAEVFRELVSLSEGYRGLTHDVLGATGKLWPCPDPAQQDGQAILFAERFPTPSGRGKFVPCTWQPARELPDAEFPFVLNTGRVLEHWHTGSMTRRSQALAQIEPEAFACIHPADLARLGLAPGGMVRVSSRRGAICLKARADDTLEPGCVFIPFHFREAAANVLTIDALDPFGKIPEFKFCAVRVEPLAQQGTAPPGGTLLNPGSP